MTQHTTLLLAIARSRPPTTMPGYWRCWRTWLRVACGLGRVTGRQYDRLLREYQAAALRACEEAQL